MKFILRIILIGLASYFVAPYLPWWNIALVSAIVSFLLPGNGFNVWLSGFLGAGLLWMGMTWKIDTESASIMSERIIALFPVDDLSMLIIATALIGGSVGGFSALTGSLFRKIFTKKKKTSYYN